MITLEQVHNSLKRVTAFYTHLDAQKIASYVQSVYEVFGSWADPFLFESACVDVVKNLDSDSRSLPKPGEYRAHYHIRQDAQSSRPESVGTTQSASDRWCLDEIERYYSPEMAWEKLEELNANKRAIASLSPPVLEALMRRSAGADAAKLESRKRKRNERPKIDIGSDVIQAEINRLMMTRSAKVTPLTP